jgi:phosphomannomutase
MTQKTIRFGTDGWRGIIADDFTLDRVALVAATAARVLESNYSSQAANRTIIVGYDRRFMAETFAQKAATAITEVGFDVLLADTYAPTPAFSWAAYEQKALGAIVLTASHNPARYLGLKVKGHFGGSVSGEITQQIENQLSESPEIAKQPGSIRNFSAWEGYCRAIQSQIDLQSIRQALQQGKLAVFADVMHGAAAGGLAKILDVPINEVNSDRDPLFDGGAPEPLPRYLSQLSRQIRRYHRQYPQPKLVGLVFDGDSDRIAAVDQQGTFLSSQILIPILIEHLTQRQGKSGEVVKTCSGSDLIYKVASAYHLPICETPIGYKYIAERMSQTQVLLGGEESGGIGYGSHIPERDALLSALYLLEAMVQSGQDLPQLYQRLQKQTQFVSTYDRIDLPLASMEVREKLLQRLQTQPPSEIAGKVVLDCTQTDGYKFRLADYSWLLIRFSGTEPVLRLYCEAPDAQQVRQTLDWAKNWAGEVNR